MYTISSKGCKKKRLPPQKWPFLSQFVQYIHVTPIIGSGILSGIHIILQNFSETCSFWKTLKNAQKGRF